MWCTVNVVLQFLHDGMVFIHSLLVRLHFFNQILQLSLRYHTGRHVVLDSVIVVVVVAVLHCAQKINTSLHSLLYLRGKCLDGHKIFRKGLGEIRYSISEIVKYSLLPVMSS